ncbi:MAG: hypothetical protein LJE62_05060 [Silicimonas sp.]|jgi:hypothetical protein|nr:hypothetical protein [Silicimonas sp.]
MRLKPGTSFSRSEEGSLSIETVFAVPILAWAMTATFVFFDAFKTQNVSQKATYTIADMISREEAPVDADYMAAMYELYDYLSGTSGENAIRISVVEMTEDPDTLERSLALVWSHGINVAEYQNLDMIEDRIPNIAPGEQLVVVESEQEWTPAFGVGLASYRFGEIALARPRFAPQICWVDATGCSTITGGGAGGSSDDGDPTLN